jgi:hypothetical protein
MFESSGIEALLSKEGKCGGNGPRGEKKRVVAEED